MSRRPETSIDGSLYELVARGEKDKFFFKDETTSIQPFDYRYQAYPAILPEVRQTVPITDIKFGNIVEFDFDFAGDLLVEANLLIDLPSWLPPDIAPLNNKSLICDNDGVTYGYTNGIAYFLCKKIEILQDNMLLQEISGDALYALSRTRGSYNGLVLDDSLAGIHDGSALSIQRAACPGRLVLRLPFPGTYIGDTGQFPIAAVKKQNFRLRVTLRKLEELVEASDSRLLPAPWSNPLYITKSRGENKILFQPIDLIKMQKPVLLLETKQLYTTNRLRELIQEEEHIICFRRYFENVFSFNDYDYSPLDRAATPVSVRLLDGQFLGERVTSFFRSNFRFRTNQLYKFQQDISENNYYVSMKLIIAGKEREGDWDAFVYADMMQHAKEERATDIGIITMNWGKGWRQGDNFPAERQPDGGINFTTAIRPQLNITLANTTYDPILKQRITEMRSIVEGWAVYQIKGGRGRFKYAN
jgi:hypothetical protein